VIYEPKTGRRPPPLSGSLVGIERGWSPTPAPPGRPPPLGLCAAEVDELRRGLDGPERGRYREDLIGTSPWGATYCRAPRWPRRPVRRRLSCNRQFLPQQLKEMESNSTAAPEAAARTELFHREETELFHREETDRRRGQTHMS
jgi:hypothetical protein